MKILSITAPVFNEEVVIAEFHAALVAASAQLSSAYNIEIIYVVDPAPDRTLEILRTIAAADARVKVLALSARFGHQMSLLAGIDHAIGDVIVMLDSDLQHPPELIPQMVQKYEEGFDIVYTVRQPAPGTSTFRRLSSKAFYGLINRLSQIPIDESAADFRLISARVANIFKTQLRERNQFLRGLISWVGFKKIGVPFSAHDRGGGRTKYSLARLLRFGVNGVIAFSKKPLQAAVLVGFGFAAMGFAMTVYSLLGYFLKGNLPSGYTTLAIMLSAFSGVQLIFLGVIGEYIGAIFDEVKARPHYIVGEKINF